MSLRGCCPVIEHAAAVVAALDAHPYLTVHRGPAPKEAVPPYVVVYVTVADERRTKMCGNTDESWLIITTHSVAANDEGVGIVRRNVRETLLDVRLTVPGWKTERIGHERGNDADWTNVAGSTYLDAVDEWDYRAEPA
jgi:hypothetical protein